jgi:PKD repeat protein
MSIHRSLFVYCLLTLCLLSACKREVDVDIIADFDYKLVDSNYSVPATIEFTNKSKGALFYHWSFSEGDIKESKTKDPGYLIVSKPGTVKVRLEVWNDYARAEKIIEIPLDTFPVADFVAAPVTNEHVPVEYNFQFTGQGATSYQWIFENANPSSSNQRNPQHILFNQPGTFSVTLIISNDRNRTDTVRKSVLVKAALVADFDILTSFDDDDLEVPVKAQLLNKTLNATQHHWACDGAIISQAADSLPLIQFNNPGTYTVVYTATNQKQTEVVRKTIQVKANSRLREFKNVHLGINTAHKETGSFFSTYLRKVIVKDSVNATNGPMIDLCFFGLNKDFSFNKFVSPVDVQQWTFTAIPGATATTLINNQEKCNCAINLSPADFDLISNGNYFDNFSIPQIAEGALEFARTAPRIVLFRNAAGKKGAIKLKEFVDQGEDSYIICDIKVQKD